MERFGTSAACFWGEGLIVAGLTSEDVGAIREAIDAYRTATQQNYRSRVPPATLTGEDTPEAWRSYEARKKVDRAEWQLIRLLQAHLGVVDSVRYQGVLYSVCKGKRWNDNISSEYELIEKLDRTLDLDWPEGAKKPDLPFGPASWGD